MGHHSLWQSGASYLEHCSMQGPARLEVLLQTIPLGSESRINKIIDIAKSNDMPHVAHSICKVQTMKCLRQGRLGNALVWALKSQDAQYSSYIADKFLTHYVKNGEIQCQDVLENLGTCMLACERLTFLGFY